MQVLTGKVRPVSCLAVRFVLGESTKTELLKLFPGANIGTMVGLPDTEIHWFHLPPDHGSQPVHDGDYIVRFDYGDGNKVTEVMDEIEFLRRVEVLNRIEAS